ncbi:MAG: D-alanyl-D-alanine carboxypeptidase family protein [Erysipelotrichaceae bacterium]|nr:D-alanyl-D-alanine carboxypeptidase family protein [Erysipelotrichaceae bacterium]
MKKLIYILLFLLILTSCNQTSTNPFYNIIKDYPHNSNLINEYEKVYNETNNIIYAINKVNYPNFLTPNSSNHLAFKINNLQLVNTNYKLSKTYIPKTLVEVTNVDYIKRSNQTMMIDQNTLNAYILLFNESLLNNLNLTIFSSYRSYEYQESLYNKEENSFIAAPGASEHQTGLAIDISTKDTGLTKHFDNTPECVWLTNNAHKYGFIKRYPKDKEHITGYPYESWHYRYVGVEVAKIIYNNNLTLEEYFYQYIIL